MREIGEKREAGGERARHETRLETGAVEPKAENCIAQNLCPRGWKKIQVPQEEVYMAAPLFHCYRYA